MGRGKNRETAVACLRCRKSGQSLSPCFAKVWKPEKGNDPHSTLEKNFLLNCENGLATAFCDFYYLPHTPFLGTRSPAHVMLPLSVRQRPNALVHGRWN